MIEQPSQDIWKYPANCVVITTNGTIRKDGACVMGRGIALQAKNKFPGIEYQIGTLIRELGNHVHLIGAGRQCTFPVKHNWWEKANLILIRRSAVELAIIAYEHKKLVFSIPHPGCHNGGRTWEEVRPLLEDILPDNVHIVDYN